MKRDERSERSIEEVLECSLPSVSKEQMESGRERILNYVQSDEAVEREDLIREAVFWPLRSFGWRRLAVLMAGAALLLVTIWIGAAWQNRGVYAVLKTPQGSLYRVAEGEAAPVEAGERIQEHEVVRSSDDTGALLALADGSRVEMRSKSVLLLERADDGVRIRLRKGSVLVTAAKQHNGHLYVQTKDVTVSVIGTVFLVNAEEEGSRVAVIEGEVRVKQGATETRLRTGEQVATNPKMEAPFVSKELEWSREAETQLASLQQGAPSPQQLQAARDLVERHFNPPPIVPATRQEKFEVVSIRSKPTVDGGRETGPLGNACLNPKIQIDPHRLSISGLSLNNIILLAYPEWADPRGGCSAVSAGGFLSGGPGWVRSDLWDIQATIPEGPVEYKVTTNGPPTMGRRGALQGRALPAVAIVEDLGPRVRGMLQNLLADRFQLVLRPETKDMPVYLLTVGKNGFKSNGLPLFARLANGQPGLLNGAPWGSSKYVATRGVHELDGKAVLLKPEGVPYQQYMSMGITKMSMPEIATYLVEHTQRPVLDRTSLAGTFDFHIDFGEGDYNDRPSIFKAIEEVGLKLEPSRAPVEIWVVERAEKLSEN